MVGYKKQQRLFNKLLKKVKKKEYHERNITKQERIKKCVVEEKYK